MQRTTFDFRDSVVLVTGGGSGIGAAVATAFLEAGATVAVTGRRRDRLEQVLAPHPDDRTLALPADLADGAEVRQLVADVVERFGRLDVVVSNAGVHAGGPITELSRTSGPRCGP